MLLDDFLYFQRHSFLSIGVLLQHVLQHLRVAFLSLQGESLLQIFPLRVEHPALALYLIIKAPDNIGLGHELLHFVHEVLFPPVLDAVESLDYFLNSLLVTR